MNDIVIAAAQSSSVKGDFAANVRIHAEFVREAVRHHADFIIFPELSLTGYEPEFASELAMSIDDRRLSPLRELAALHNTTIVAGAPVARQGNKPGIGAIVFGPEQTSVYLKLHLHPGEERYFSPGEAPLVLTVKGVKIGLAICADTAYPSHAETAARLGASVYAAGVLFCDEDNPLDIPILQKYALQHRMAVLMANHWGATGGYNGVGKSGVWDEQGWLVAVAPESTGLVIAEKLSGAWNGIAIAI